MNHSVSRVNKAQVCAQLIAESQSIGILTGAGISTNAGIPDFRGPKGLYVTRQYDPDTVFNIHHFRIDPQPFYEFARDFVGLEQSIHPTLTHRFLASLEKTGKLKGIVTQNIDSLHHKAGSQ
jgi:NAD-dependent deacetylase